MAAPFLVRKRQVAIETESVEGTAETFVDADARNLVYDPEFNFDIDIFNRNPARATLSTLPGLPGREFGTLTFRAELKGSGTNTTQPSWGKALLGCGFQEETLEVLVCNSGSGSGTDVFSDGETITGGTSSATATVVLDTTATTTNFNLLIRNRSSAGFQAAETITGGTSATTATVDTTEANYGLLYRPDSTSPSSVTVALYEDGLKKELKGARGTCRISAEVGQPAFLEFEFTGVYSEVSDTSQLSPTYESTLPPVFQSAAIKLHDTSNSWLVARSIGVDINNTVAPREDANSSTGILSFLITDRDPNGSVDPEGVLVATHDFWTRWRNGTTGIFEFDVGSTAGNQIEVRCQNTSYREVGSGDRTGLATNEVTLGIHTSDVTTSGDDEIYIIHA